MVGQAWKAWPVRREQERTIAENSKGEITERMPVGTTGRNARRGYAYRELRFPGHATVDGANSRRSTVMSALLRTAAAIHEYQSDLSSKNPTASASVSLRIRGP